MCTNYNEYNMFVYGNPGKAIHWTKSLVKNYKVLYEHNKYMSGFKSSYTQTQYTTGASPFTCWDVENLSFT